MAIDNLTNTQVLKLKGRIFTLTVVQLLNKDIYAFEHQVEEVVNKAPKLFYKIPVVLDCSLLNEELSSFLPYFSALKKFHLYPIGVQGPQTWLGQLASLQVIPVFQSSSANDKAIQQQDHKKKASADKLLDKEAEQAPRQTKLITHPVRSGQQVFAKGGDLVIVSSVGHGAELLADGNIHVYGPLRGRALAGISDDKQARIFCTQLDAELISIAGFYRLRESIPSMNGPCQIFIQDDRLQVLPI